MFEKILSAVDCDDIHISKNWVCTLPFMIRTVRGFIFSTPLSFQPSVAIARPAFHGVDEDLLICWSNGTINNAGGFSSS